MSVLHHMLLSRVTNNIPDYFCLVALEDGTFTFNINENAQLTSIAYSLDGRNWTSSTTTLTTPTVAKGKSVYWKGVATKYSANSDSNTNNSYFSSTGNFYVKGDLMSLFYGDNFENQFEIPDTYAAASLFENCSKLLYANKLILKATTLKTGCYGRMFYNCTNLLAYPKLPATSLEQRCYAFMFGYCRSMITAPELPATDLAYYCYQAMFYYCTNLINPPELPATTLIAYCYMRMFERCSNLEVAPDLLASNLERYCYYYMFRYCTKLRFINAQFEDTTIPDGALSNWVGGVASEGIFLKNPISEFSTVGNSGIPTGWTVWTEVPDWLCFTALESGTFTLTIPAAVTATYLSYIEWSKDGRTWNHTDNTSEAVTIDVQVAQGEKVYWRGSGKRMSYSGNSGYTSGFSSTGAFSISGHLVSILKGSDFEDIYFLGATFARLFQDCSNLISAGELILPSFTAASVFSSLFLRCTALVSAPELPPVTNLTTGCYYQMFFGCSSLAYVKCLATDISATNCLQNWLYGVSSTGTFIQAEGVEWPRGARGIPTGWVDIEKRTMPTGYKQVEYLSNPNKPSSTPMPLVETGIILDPSQDTFEIAVYPHFDTDGYIAHHSYGGMPFASHPSPSGSGAKVGRFYINFRAYANQTNAFACAWTKETSTASSFYVSNKITENPQVLRIELSSGDNKMLLNGTQIASNTDTYNVSDMGTETAKLFGVNNVGYNWIDPIYYMKWWRNGVLIADYVACVRESDNEPSFYDFVSNTFKVPTRTGFFTAGEEI